jgi:methionyl-tRNA synthetase
VLEPEKLLNPRAKTGDGALELRDTEHFYLDLSKLEPNVKDFLRERAGYMRETVLGESLRKIESEGLKPRSITRDLDWGIPIPVEGWEGKRIYVWFDRMEPAFRPEIRLERMVDEPGRETILFHRQGQHLLPYFPMAG